MLPFHPLASLRWQPAIRGFTATALLLGAGLATPNAARANTTEMLIICPASLEPAFQTLAGHRTGAGVECELITLEQLLASTPAGVDDAATVREYLVQRHASGPLAYVLLGGDAGLMPTRQVASRFYPSGSTTMITTDLYFAGLDGNWDADGDGLFGEAYQSSTDPGDNADLDPELAVGRAPVDNLAQAQRFVQAVIQYDTAGAAGHLDAALLSAEVLLPDDWDGGSVTLDGAYYAEQLRDQLALHPVPVSSVRLYENHAAYAGSQPLGPPTLLADLGSGAFGTVFHVGHGTAGTLSAGSGTVGLAELATLENAPDYHLFLASSAFAAAFDGDCILEQLVVAPLGGSVAGIGPTQEYFPSTGAQYFAQLVEELTAEASVPVGRALQASLAQFAPNTALETSSRWTSLTLTLLGDPAMPYRVEEDPIATQRRSFGGFKSGLR